MPTNVLLLNLIVFGVLMEADLGRRKVGWFRVLRPLIMAATIVPLFLTSLPTSGDNLALEAIGAVVGVILGLACHAFVSVRFDPEKGKNGRVVSRAGLGYAMFWAVVFGARLAFIYGSEHLFSSSLGQFMAAHQLSAAGLTDALIFMALAMALARSALLGERSWAITRRHNPTQLRVA